MAKALIGNWSCESCGADASARAKDCCDACILTIFSGVHSLELEEAFASYSSVSDWNADNCNYAPEGAN